MIDSLLLPGWGALRVGMGGPHQVRLTEELEAAVAMIDFDTVIMTIDEMVLLNVLARTVAAAMYWEEPDAEDRALASPEVYAALQPIARAVAEAPAAQWWASPVDLNNQQYVEWLSDLDEAPPQLSGAAAELDNWRYATLKDEQAAQERPPDPSAPWGGQWWSVPQISQLLSTTRSLTGLAAVGLALVEDGLGETKARCWPLQPRSRPRVYEISRPEHWVELVDRYPFDVSKARRHNWWRVTGCEGTWLIPDWTLVASDYDAVHLSVCGYLTTAGRALPVGQARTLLAGWDPDATYWLTDILTLGGPAVLWLGRQDEPQGWTTHLGI